METNQEMKTKLTFLLSLTFVFLFSGSSVVFGDDFQDGVDAYKRKDYKTAYKLWLPLAEQGNLRAKRRLARIELENAVTIIELENAVKLEKMKDCSEKFPKEKNMITVKGFYIGMSICDAEKLIKEGKYKSVFAKEKYRIKFICSMDSSCIQKNYAGKVTKIYFKKNLLHNLFKSNDMSLAMFTENFGKYYIKGKFMFEMEPHNDFRNNNIGYKYYNGEVGYKFFIKQNESGTGVQSLTIEKVAKVSEGFGD